MVYFVSGYRFSDTASSFEIKSPLGAGHDIQLFSKGAAPDTNRSFSTASNPWQPQKRSDEHSRNHRPQEGKEFPLARRYYSGYYARIFKS
jgi:hypothetical protein